ncbi:MAG TPA: hypothetical protein VGO50_12080 [Pyrinomonadaceae bacterium]|jgi:hypothetical protein|nr:hypothetical protein [Pyrinomonadaceae bacterium]
MLTLFAAAFAITIASLVSINTFSQTSKSADTGNAPVVWNRVELPVKPVDSGFRLDIPAFNSGADYIIGVKPVTDGEKEKMYAGIVTWEEDQKIKGLLHVSKMENYPVEAGRFPEGKAAFDDVLGARQTLIIYLEVAPATHLMLDKADSGMALNSSDGSFVVFNGKREAAKIDKPSALLNELHKRKAVEGIMTIR